MSEQNFDSLKSAILEGRFKVAVYGLGHVGASIAAVWLRMGAHVIGIDKSSAVLQNARAGRTHIPEPGVNEAYSKGLLEKRFYPYDDPVRASVDARFKMICVPVLAANGSADLSAVREVAKAIAKGLKRGDAVSLNPSVPPGTTEEVVLPILEKASGLKAERDFYLLYNPERIYEGRAIEDIEERYPGVVSGTGPKSVEMGIKLFSLVFRKGIITMDSIKTAETEKLLEGVYRDVNIALANEMARYCERLGVDFWKAREAANSQPYCHIHKPGAGVGGACIPVYPQFILHSADRLKISCDITKTSRKINDSMPAHCVKEASKLLVDSALAVGKDKDKDKSRGSKIGTAQPRNGRRRLAGRVVTLLGLAFRGDVSDTRLSPTYDIIKLLQKEKVKQIRIHDPIVAVDPMLKRLSESKGSTILLTSDLSEALKCSDLAILVTDHSQYRQLTQEQFHGTPVYDGRGILDKSKFDESRFVSIGTPGRQGR